MSINKLKSIVRRGTMLGAAFAVVAATFAPASLTFADALNPLTHRSLTLSSSAPGWDHTDGSGNTTYAPPNSGANGQKTGNTFAFNVSTNSTAAPIKAFTLQYCTGSAGNCTSPGNNGHVGATRNVDSATTTDLNVVTSSPTEISGTTFTALFNTTLGIPVGNATNSTPATITGAPKADDTEGNFVVLTQPAAGGSWSQSAGWTMTATNKEDGTVTLGTATGANNYIKIVNTTGAATATGDAVKIIFFGTNGNYITNPGQGAFFVKINDYNSDTTINDTTLVDGGVTVANVMNQSIEIQTKVLETMDFSVGTVDPYTLVSDGTTGSALYAASHLQTHGQCDPIATSLTYGQNAATNVLQMGDTTQENSLRTDKTYSTHSFWRLSSNSSAGATVYYSGSTLKNTVNDQINPIGKTASFPLRGTPQFGLAIDNAKTGNLAVNYTNENNGGTGLFENGTDINTNGIDASTTTDTASLTGYHSPQLAPLAPTTGYADGAGIVNNEYGTVSGKFAFDPNANIVPAPIATENAQVVDCVTAKVRYIANIAATTPAGIYTTKINYIAAPQY
ncbi:MAG TPA: hypothetical protein VIM31_04890 [Candidatus Microsaccharimonas sp.]